MTVPGRGLERARQIDQALRARKHRVNVRIFSETDAVRFWAMNDGTPCSLLICIGGDGTQSAAAVAAVQRSVPFLPVPSGFGNLFAGALREPRRVEQVVDLVDHGALLPVDVGRRNGQLFLCQESFGLLQQIQDRTEAAGRAPSRWQRSLTYYSTALRDALRDNKLPRLRVTVDGRVMARDAVIVTVANVETYGPWLKLTPGASPIDGLFDVFVMRGRNKREVLSRLVKRRLRLAAPDERTLVWRGRRVTVASRHGAPDKLVLLPRRLRVVVSVETVEALCRDLASKRGAAPDQWRSVA